MNHEKFINRKETFDKKDTYPMYRNKAILEGHILVFDSSIFKIAYQTPEHQLFLADFGIGTVDEKDIDNGIYGYFLDDKRKFIYRFDKSSFIGILKDELIAEYEIKK